MRSFPLTLAFCAVTLAQAVAQQPTVIYFHGDMLTGTHLRAGDASPIPARVSALAVRGGKIVAVGSDAEVLTLKGPATVLVDLHGAFAMPGFNDAHTHIASAGEQRLALDLDNVPTLSTMQLRVKDYAMGLPPRQWILGGGWDHTKWATPGEKQPALPTRRDLDPVSGGHPLLLERTDGHIAVVNTAALREAGITDATPDPPGGKIDRDAQGVATGIIREAPALALIEVHVPKPDAATRRKALQLALDDALAHGVSSVQDFSDWDDFLMLEQMEKEGRLHVRVSEWLAFNDPLEVLKAHRAAHPLDDPLLHTGMLKGFMDGSLGSRTAALAAPYTDDPGNSGIPRYEQAKLNAMTIERAEAGFLIGFHAIGDRANTMALNAFQAERDQRKAFTEQCYKEHPEKRSWGDACGTFPRAPWRERIEHAQVLLPADFERFHKLGVIASMQPSHLLTDMAWAGARLGPERSQYAYAWRSFLDYGVVLAFGTDYPVESISPFRGLYSAVTRMNEAGTQTFQPQEKLTIQQAIYAYTQGSAFAEGWPQRKGVLAPGYLADIVVLDRDITRAAPQELLQTKVLRTVVGGETVYTAPAQPAR